MKAPLMQDQEGQIEESYSISAGLDFPSVGPQHAHLAATGRATYESATDDEALAAFELLAKCEGIIPALESAHAIAYAVKLAKEATKETLLVVNLSGRGDKDIFTVADILAAKSVQKQHRRVAMSKRYQATFAALKIKIKAHLSPLSP